MASRSRTPSSKSPRVSTARRGRHLGPDTHVGKMVSLSSVLVERARLARAANLLTFAGKRDVSEALGYLTTKQITFTECLERYRRNEVAGRVVDALPTATWSGNGEVIEDERVDQSTAFEEEFAKLRTRLDVWPKFLRLDRMAGLGRYAVMVIGAAGSPSSELPKMKSTDEIQYLKIYNESDAEINPSDFVTDAKDPRYGYPNFYTIKRSDAVGRSIGTARVHYTRVIHVADCVMDDELFGESRLIRVWNRLDDLEKVVGGGSEAFWQLVNPGLHLSLDKDVELSPEEENKLSDEFDEYTHGMRRIARTRGVKLDQMRADVANYDRQVGSILSLISAGSTIPQRILLGSERGQLASSQDDENWNKRVRDRQMNFAEPVVVRPFVDRLIEYGALPKPVEYQIQWPSIDVLSESDKAEIGERMASMNQKNGSIVVTTDEIRDKIWGLPPLDEVLEVVPDPAASSGDQNLDEGDQADAPVSAETDAEDEPAYKAIHRAADASLRKVTRSVHQSFLAAIDAVTVADIERAFEERHNATLTDDIIEAMTAALDESLADQLFDVLVAGADAAAKMARRDGFASLVAAVEIDFDKTNPEAIRWAERHASDLIKGISAETRDAINAVIARAFRDGIPPRTAARMIKSLVGLTTRQAEAVVNFRFRLMEAQPGAQVMAGKLAVRVPKSGLTGEYLDRASARYAERLLKQRSEAIARTATIAASNEGQSQLWKQAVKAGILPADATRVWISAGDACEKICRPMDGQERGLTENFESPQGRSVHNPPVHTSCRCSTGLIRAGRVTEAK